MCVSVCLLMFFVGDERENEVICSTDTFLVGRILMSHPSNVLFNLLIAATVAYLFILFLHSPYKYAQPTFIESFY